MPYIKQERRDVLDPDVEVLLSKIHSVGEVNYVITRIVDAYFLRKYDDLNAAIGVLECVKQELYRRKVAPYEDGKMKENGDVFVRMR